MKCPRCSCGRLALLVLSAGCANTLGNPPPQDAGTEERLEILAKNYEYELRGYAPYPQLAKHSYYCSEVVGAFCLWQQWRPHGVEPPQVVEARSAYVSVLREVAARRPHDTLIAGPLVRVLTEGGFTGEAVDAAVTFAEANREDPWSYLLLGFALYADRQTVAAERAFAAAAQRMAPDQREWMTAPTYLISPEERVRYGELSAEERARYLAELWRAADLLYLTSGNEVRAAHFVRYVYVHLLERAPRFPFWAYTTNWEDGLEELTRRFGVPDLGAGNEFLAWVNQPTPLHLDKWVPVPQRRRPRGWFDPENLMYVPPDFSREKLPPPAEPGTTLWFRESPPPTLNEALLHRHPPITQNGFHPPTTRTMSPLEHQLSRFPEGDSTILRADVELALDDVAPADAPVEVGFFVLDSALNILTERRDTVTALGKLADASLEMTLPPGSWAYSVEARDTVSYQSARARHRLPQPLTGELTVSDLVLLPARTDAPVRGERAFRPFGSLALDSAQEIGAYVEVSGLEAGEDGKVHVRLDMHVAEGKEGGEETSALTWTHEAESAERVPVRVDLGALRVGEGLHRLILRVTDETSGRSATRERLVKMRRADVDAG